MKIYDLIHDWIKRVNGSNISDLMKNTKTILAVGSIAIDSLETPSGNRSNILGGSAIYFSVAASISTLVKLVGVVGSDYPEGGWALLKSRAINTDNILVEKGKTFCWGGKYSADYSSRETQFTELGVFETFSPAIIKKDCQSPLVFLGNIQPQLQLEVADLTKDADYIVSDTMNLWIDQCQNQLRKVISKSRIFLINHEEAAQLTGMEDISTAGRKLLSMGPEVVVIKRGSNGAYLGFGEEEYYVPVYPVNKVLDPTGAGDSFAGGLLGYLATAEKINYLDAVLAGSAMASFCVEGFGVEGLLKVTSPLLEKRIQKIRNLAQLELAV